MSTPAASAASKLASVLPGAIRSAPLWPTRRNELTSGIAGTSMSCGWRRPDRAPGFGRPQRGHGSPARRWTCGRRRAGALHRGALHSRAHGVDHGEGLGVGDLGNAAPRIDPGDPAALCLPHVPDPGHVALVKKRVTEPAGLVVPAQAPQEALPVELDGEHVGAQRRQALVESRAPAGHQLEQRPVELDDLGARSGAGRATPARTRASIAGPVRTRPTPRSSRDASGSRDRPRIAGRGACRMCRPSRPPAPQGARPSGRTCAADAG